MSIPSWNPYTPYSLNVQVTYGGVPWKCILVPNVNRQPNISPLYWTQQASPTTAVQSVTGTLPGIVMTGTDVNPIVNNGGVLSVGTTPLNGGIAITGTAQSPIVALDVATPVGCGVAFTNGTGTTKNIAANLIAGPNITLTPSIVNSSITVSATSGGSGTVTSVGAGLGISVDNTTTPAVPVVSTNLVAGAGIALSGTTAQTIATNLTAGAGIAISGSGAQTIATNLIAGNGIGISGTGAQTLTTNLATVAGGGLALSYSGGVGTIATKCETIYTTGSPVTINFPTTGMLTFIAAGGGGGGSGGYFNTGTSNCIGGGGGASGQMMSGSLLVIAGSKMTVECGASGLGGAGGSNGTGPGDGGSGGETTITYFPGTSVGTPATFQAVLQGGGGGYYTDGQTGGHGGNGEASAQLYYTISYGGGGGSAVGTLTPPYAGTAGIGTINGVNDAVAYGEQAINGADGGQGGAGRFGGRGGLPAGGPLFPTGCGGGGGGPGGGYGGSYNTTGYDGAYGGGGGGGSAFLDGGLSFAGGEGGVGFFTYFFQTF